MNAKAKTLIPEQEWLVRNAFGKIGSISKNKRGYEFLFKGHTVPFKSLSEIGDALGDVNFEDDSGHLQKANDYSIYGFPCDSKPFEPVYDVKRRLPIFIKNEHSKSHHCAGYYVIKFRKGWVKSFCPKLISLDRYEFLGPVKTEEEMKILYNEVTNGKTT